MRIAGKQCKGKTKAGSRCIKLVSWSEGNYCSIHKPKEVKKKEILEASTSGKE